MNWLPISAGDEFKRTGARVMLATTYPKARYKIVTGKWVAKFGEWQSEPGGWPIKPTHIAPMPEGPEA